MVDVWCCLIALALSLYSCRMSTSLPWWPSHSLAASSPSSVSWWASSPSLTSGQFHQSPRCSMLIIIGIQTYDWSQLLSLIPKSTVLLHYLVTNPTHSFILFIVFVMVYFCVPGTSSVTETPYTKTWCCPWCWLRSFSSLESPWSRTGSVF